MQCGAASSKMNSMPALGASDLRCMRPCERLDMSAATSARIRCMPAESCVTGSGWAAADAATSNRGRENQRMNEKGRVVALPFSSFLRRDLLLHFVFFGSGLLLRLLLLRSVLLGLGLLGLRLGLGLLLGLAFLLRRRLGFAFGRLLLGLLLVLHLRAAVRRREGGSANRRKHRGNDQRQQLVHFLLLVNVFEHGPATNSAYPGRDNAPRVGKVDRGRILVKTIKSSSFA